ncbi:carboxymuconolactone decarboxylase family protein [Dokdonella sp.]|uniref:carboxymuconolactone decarboxylase family protein n=1 Tax=Dokdonella sp. TaxID=2291710 RepID=UPI0026083387|nr:carboxymuconolactone decarboxylase family protein [Dokdonella sp.]
MNHEQPLSERQLAIVPIAAFAASGDMVRLGNALQAGLDAGLTVNEIKELLVQMYAYAGFPRSLNALTQLMKVLDERKARGIADPAGATPSPLPPPERLHEIGTANQTRLSGAPVKGPLFDFAPQADAYLKEHLFGAIFARDNVSWADRELATLGGIAVLPGANAQLAAHMRIGRNVGLTEAQLREVVAVLRERVASDAGERAESARQGTAPGTLAGDRS